MEHREEIEEQKRRAEQLINQAEMNISKDRITAGLKLYQKATDIYFNIGQYMKIPDMFIRISTLMDKESTIYAAMEYLRTIKDRLRQLDLPEEEAKIMMVMGNLSFKIEDYESAAEYYEECADLYLKAEPIEYRSASAMFLIRAAECYEHLPYIHEKGERIMIQAALRVNQKALDYQAEEFKGLKLIKLNKYKDAIPIYIQLYEFFIEALDNLSAMIVDTPEIRSIAIFAKTRLIHIISEYRLILMILYDRDGNKEKSKNMAMEAIDHLNTGIEMIRSMILQGIWAKDDLKRLTYEGFMRAYFQKYWHIKNPTPDMQIQYYILEGIGGEPAEAVKRLPYYDLCVKTESYSIEQLDELLYGFNLGRLDKYKEIFMKKR